jgi:hypothetical protein
MSSDSEGFQTVNIDFANAKMEMPRSYKRVSVEELENLLVNSGGPEDLKQLQIGKFELVKAFPAHFIIYSDTANSENTIWFQKGEHITMTKSIAQQYRGMLEQHLEEQWKPFGIEYDRMESIYISANDIQIIKLKYMLNYQDLERYTTQYLISTKTQTWGIIVNGITASDYEDNVRRLKVR